VTLIVVPVVLALALALTPVLVKMLDRNAGWVLAAAFAALAAYIFTDAGTIIDGRDATFSATWLEGVVPGGDGSGGDIEFALRMDSLGLFFTLLALLIGTAVFAYSARYLHRGEHIMNFYVLMSAFMFSVVLLFLADDVALLFIGWELVSLASFFLIARAGHTGEPGAVRTLILTFTGGLSLLVALGIAVASTGTTNLSDIIASDIWSQDSILTGIVAVLVAVAGFTKAAQLPFHSWLPEAMAAATPVSAFLHAAAVVKAGIYLLIRFSGIFSDVLVWNLLLIIVGMSTAVMAAVFAFQQTDLKRLTAYSTVSQLGWIVATIGIGTPFALAAAVVHTAAHAMFKSSLFMIIGVIDHQTGTRDIRELGSIWRRMPWTFTAALLSVASMAGLPPLLGFVSKEGMLESFLESPLLPGWEIVLLVGASLGALATFMYSAKYLLGAFIDSGSAVDGADRPDMSEVKEAPVSFWLPAAIPGVLSLPAVVFLSTINKPLDAVVESVGSSSPHSHLMLWHGFGIPLYITIGVVLVGCLLLLRRQPLADWLEDHRLFPFTGNELIGFTLRLANRWGRLVSRLGNTLSPNTHLLWIFVMILVLSVAAFFGPGGLEFLGELPPREDGIDQLSDLLGLLIMFLVTMAIISTRSRMGSVILVGVAGGGVSWIMLTLGAPDVALTNLMVEFIVTAFLMLVVRHQPRLYLKEGENRTKFAVTLAAVVGLVVFVGVWLLVGRHPRPELAQWYINESPDVSEANNIVATIIVEFRALDTLGELSVLGMAGLVIASIVASVPKSPVPGYGPGSTAELFRKEGSTKFPDVHKVPELAPFYSKYLRSTHLNSILGRMVVWPMLGVLVIYSAVTFYRGHQAPGGGFLAALMLALGLVFWYLVQPSARQIGGKDLGYQFVGGGIVLAVVTGIIGFYEGSFLAPIHFNIGSEHFSSSLFFDGGVYLAVIGIVVIVLNTLGGRDRPGAEPGKRVKASPVESSRPLTGSESHSKAYSAVRNSSVAVTAGGSSIPLNPSDVKAEYERNSPVAEPDTSSDSSDRDKDAAADSDSDSDSDSTDTTDTTDNGKDGEDR
jgi:multicomponent Na+:H+ antiporter subunit A